MSNGCLIPGIYPIGCRLNTDRFLCPKTKKFKQHEKTKITGTDVNRRFCR